MSNDLISRSALIEFLKEVTVTEGITFETGFKQIITDINNQPTAYNVDEVVEQMKNMYIPIVEDLGDASYELVRKREAIDIVKWGGVNEIN